ncbi:MAG: kinase/pyrophosphorylase [Alphaproteobacteria bacterium]|nr:kinase/pyrophosphorylase [Alphaproteobacteria bacterium]
MAEGKRFHLHLISDATGETINSVARAALAQFDGVEATEHMWPLVRSRRQLDKVLTAVEANPGIVMFTLVNKELREHLQATCRSLQVPCVPVLEPLIAMLSSHFGVPSRDQPGRQHVLDAEYFARIDAIHFVLAHDDGQSTQNLDYADVVLVGVSRTSKTPTCFYLANRGIKAANVPIVPGMTLPASLFSARKPLIVGLTNSPDRLVQVRRNRLLILNQAEDTDYVDLDQVRAEVAAARRLFAEHRWPVIDVTRRSIEETAAAILQLHQNRQEGLR